MLLYCEQKQEDFSSLCRMVKSAKNVMDLEFVFNEKILCFILQML